VSGKGAARFDAAIVDLDGTMVDTVPDFVAALDAALGDLGLPVVGRDFVERTVGKGSEHIIRGTLAHLGAATALYEPACRCAAPWCPLLHSAPMFSTRKPTMGSHDRGAWPWRRSCRHAGR
jgi:phosphoglycolate phosphatase-like HAD superfamily hydrolase